MDQNNIPTVFDILKGNTHVIDLELEHIVKNVQIARLEDEIRKNGWETNRSRQAIDARSKLDILRKRQFFFEEILEKIAREYNVNVRDYYIEHLFKHHHWTLIIKSKEIPE